eukprot:ANDGO_06826.mRNA.1 ERAD-associated E3 ubiquitin-protein ligase HRD1
MSIAGLKFGFYSYLLVSLAAAGIFIHRAFVENVQYFPAMIYLLNSKTSLAVLGNAGLAILFSIGKLGSKVFFGALRTSEMETLSEQATVSSIQTLLALTMFHEDLSIQFSVLFAFLFFCKAFYWLGSTRFKYLQQTPQQRLLPVYKVGSLFLLLTLTATYFSFKCTQSIYESYMLLFVTEWLILAIRNATLFVNFVVYAKQIQVDGTWERTGTFLFYVELVSDLLQFAVFTIFFVLFTVLYGFPIYFLRDVFASLKRFQQRIDDIVRYRRISANIDQWFPTVNMIDLPNADHTCVVCREDMVEAKQLRCGHCFHRHCLLTWAQQNNSCPLCRSSILQSGMNINQNPDAGVQHRPGAERPNRGINRPAQNANVPRNFGQPVPFGFARQAPQQPRPAAPSTPSSAQTPMQPSASDTPATPQQPNLAEARRILLHRLRSMQDQLAPLMELPPVDASVTGTVEIPRATLTALAAHVSHIHAHANAVESLLLEFLAGDRAASNASIEGDAVATQSPSSIADASTSSAKHDAPAAAAAAAAASSSAPISSQFPEATRLSSSASSASSPRPRIPEEEENPNSPAAIMRRRRLAQFSRQDQAQ